MSKYFEIIDKKYKNQLFIEFRLNIPGVKPTIGMFENKVQIYKWIEKLIALEKEKLRRIELNYQQLRQEHESTITNTKEST